MLFIYELIILLHLVIIKTFNKSKKVTIAICSIGKLENLYVKEWVDYYKSKGVNKIIIGDNNDLNGERFEDVLSKDIKSKFVQIVNYRGMDKMQSKVYQRCYDENKNEFDWLLFIDLDEFITVNSNKTFKEYLSASKFKQCESIKLNWITYGDNNLVHYDNRPVQERFTIPSLIYYYENINHYSLATKSLVRGHLNLNWKSSPSVHFPLNIKNACNNVGQFVNPYEVFQLPNFKEAYIKHYAIKTIDEFVIKLKKGRAGYKYNYLNNKKETKTQISYLFSHIFLNKEKFEILEKELNIDLSEYKGKSGQNIFEIQRKFMKKLNYNRIPKKYQRMVLDKKLNQINKLKTYRKVKRIKSIKINSIMI